MLQMLNESELKTLQKLDDVKTLKEVAESIERSTSYTSEIIKNLEQKELIQINRDGRKKLISPSKTKTIELYKKTTRQHPHIDFPELLSGKTIPLLYYLDDERTVSELAEKTGNYRNTVNRKLKKLQDRGIVKKQEKYYQLNPEFEILNRFAKEYTHHKHKLTIEKITHNYSIIWESLNEFLVETSEEIPDNYKPTNNETGKFILTGYSRFQEYGIPLLTTNRNYYFYSEKQTEITPEDLVCHSLLIDPGTRTKIYCLMLIQTQRLDKELLEKSKKYDLTDTVESLIKYLETNGKEKEPDLPSWDEFVETAYEYGVEL